MKKVKIISEEHFLKVIKEPLTKENQQTIKEYLLNKEYFLALDMGDDEMVGITVLNLPGCFSASTPLEIVENAHEAISLHIDGILEDGIEEGVNYLTSNAALLRNVDSGFRIVKIKPIGIV